MQMRYTSSLGGYTRDDGDVWKQFIGWVNDDYRALTGGTAAAYESVGRLTVPDSITVSGRDYPVTAVEEDAFAAAPESVFLGANVQNLPSGRPRRDHHQPAEQPHFRRYAGGAARLGRRYRGRAS